MRWLVALTTGLFLALAASCVEGAPEEAGPEDGDTERSCALLTRGYVDTLQRYVDGLEETTTVEFQMLESAPKGIDPEVETARYRRNRVELGCDREETRALLSAELEELSGDGTVAAAAADSLKRRLLGNPVPAERRLSTSEDLGVALMNAPADARIELDEGVHRLRETVFLHQRVTLTGAGVAETRIVSDAQNAGVVSIGAGGLRMEDLTLAQRGDTPASLLVIRSGPYSLHRIRVEGARAGEDGSLGVGIVLGDVAEGPEPDEPVRGPERIADTKVIGNDVAGIVVRGRTEPRIRNIVARDNGGCGVCYVHQAGGVLRGSSVTGNRSGVEVVGEASPRIEENTIEGNTERGVLFEGDAAGVLDGNSVAANAQFGIVVRGEAAPELTGNTIRDHARAGVVFGGSAGGTLTEGDLRDNRVAVWVEGNARPAVDANHIAAPTSLGGMVFMGSSGGRARGNEIHGPDIGIEVSGSAGPTLERNLVAGSGQVGLTFREQAGGHIVANTCRATATDLLLRDAAVPALHDNGCEVVDERP